MIIRFLLAPLLLLSALPAWADCRDPTTQAEMNACAARELSNADAELNAAYKTLMRQLDEKQRAEVKAIQLAWIKFKDLNCRFESSQAAGGTMQPLLLSSCLTELTRQRTKVLRDWKDSF